MIEVAIYSVLGSTALFGLYSFVTTHEQRRGKRFVLGGVRGWLDGVVARGEAKLRRAYTHFTRYVVQLRWYYAMHSFLQAILGVIVSSYDYFKDKFESNRTRTRAMRAEKKAFARDGHLNVMAQHKKDTALTPAQQRRLKKKKLEEKF